MTMPYIVLLTTGEATIPFGFVSPTGVDIPEALARAAEAWAGTADGQAAEEAYLKWWNTPPMYRPLDRMGWEVALALLPDDILGAHGLERVPLSHSTVEPGESVDLGLVKDPPRPVQVASSRILAF